MHSHSGLTCELKTSSYNNELDFLVLAQQQRKKKITELTRVDKSIKCAEHEYKSTSSESYSEDSSSKSNWQLMDV